MSPMRRNAERNFRHGAEKQRTNRALFVAHLQLAGRSAVKSGAHQGPRRFCLFSACCAPVPEAAGRRCSAVVSRILLCFRACFVGAYSGITRGGAMPYKDPEKRANRQAGKRARSRKVGSGKPILVHGKSVVPAARSIAGFRSPQVQTTKTELPCMPLTATDSAATAEKKERRANFQKILGWCALGVLIFLGLAGAGQNMQPRVGQQ
jgi:hypothetical protein